MESCCKGLNNCQWLNWTDKKKSGILLASINLFFLSMFVFKLSFISVLAYLFLFYLIAGTVAMQLLHKPEPEANAEYEHISKESFEKFLKTFYSYVISFEESVSKACSLTDIVYTAKFVASFYVVSVLSSIFSDTFLLFALINLLFLWKPVYNTQKDKFDKLSGTVANLYNVYSKKVVDMIPKYTEKSQK